jgi:predicted phage terminase large subunit-like protein
MLNDGERAEYLKLIALKDKRDCEKSFYHFFKRAWRILEPETELLDNWHYEIICKELQEQAERIANKLPKKHDLIINLPPRSAKSTIISICFNAWCWIKYPFLRFVTASYSSTLSVEHSSATRRLINSEWYQGNWGKNFQINTDQSVKSFFENNKRGYRMATSVGATAMGRGGNFLIADDALSREQSVSDLMVKRCNDWWDGTMSTRLNNRDIDMRIIIMQRLREDDLTGTMMLRHPGKYKLISIPGELTERTSEELKQFYKDGLFFPAKFSRNVLDDLRKELREYGYSGQILQEPAPAEGGMFKKAFWKYWKEIDLPNKWDEKIQTWDMTFKEKNIKGSDLTIDYVVGQVWGRIGVTKFLLEQLRGKWDLAQTLTAVRELSLIHSDCSGIFIEDKANGDAVNSLLKKEFPNIVMYSTDKDKYSRSLPAQRQQESGSIYLPDPTEKPWVEEFIDECKVFPKGKNDDQVDCMSMAIERLTFMPRVVPGYGKDHYFAFNIPTGGEKYASLVLLKNMTIQGLCFTWDNQERKLYVFNEILNMDNLTTFPENVYGNDKMFKDGQNTAYFIRKKGIRIRENGTYDESGAILTLNQMVQNKMLIVHQNCFELDKRLKSWSLKNNAPDQDEMGIVESLLIIVSILREKGKTRPEVARRLTYRSIRGRDLMDFHNRQINRPTLVRPKTSNWLL